jgi:hypothetical protein
MHHLKTIAQYPINFKFLFIINSKVPPDQLSQADSLNLVDENFSEHHEAPVGQQQSQTGQKEEEEAALQGAGGKVENEQEKQVVGNYRNLYFLLNGKFK